GLHPRNIPAAGGGGRPVVFSRSCATQARPRRPNVPLFDPAGRARFFPEWFGSEPDPVRPATEAAMKASVTPPALGDPWTTPLDQLDVADPQLFQDDVWPDWIA